MPSGIALLISEDGKNVIFKEKKNDKIFKIDIQSSKVGEKIKAMHCLYDLCMINQDSDVYIVGGHNEITLLEKESLNVISRIKVVGEIRGVCADASQTYVFILVDEMIYRFNLKTTYYYTETKLF